MTTAWAAAARRLRSASRACNPSCVGTRSVSTESKADTARTNAAATPTAAPSRESVQIGALKYAARSSRRVCACASSAAKVRAMGTRSAVATPMQAFAVVRLAAAPRIARCACRKRHRPVRRGHGRRGAGAQRPLTLLSRLRRSALCQRHRTAGCARSPADGGALAVRGSCCRRSSRDAGASLAVGEHARRPRAITCVAPQTVPLS